MNIVPQLVLDTETRKLCIQVKVGSHVATQELPDELATATGQELRDYFEGVVPEMIAGLHEQRRKEMKAFRKRSDAEHP